MNSFQKLIKDINEAQKVVSDLIKQLDSINAREINVTIEYDNVFVETSDYFHKDRIILLKEPLSEEVIEMIVCKLRRESLYCQAYYIKSEGSRTDITITTPSSFYPAILDYITSVTKGFRKL